MLRLGWFSTGRDEAARQLLQVVHRAIKEGRLGAEIAFVFSNRKPGESRESDFFFQFVESFNIPLVHLSYRDFIRNATAIPERDIRSAYDSQVMKLLDRFTVDLCVLAGYMLIVSPDMCRRYPMINLHPAAPGGPKGTWQEVVWQLIEQRSATSGVMMHLVTPELDRGPVITYCTYSIRGPAFDPLWQEIESQPLGSIRRRQGESNALLRRIREEGLKREFPLILATLDALSRGNIRLTNGIIDGKNGGIPYPRDLTDAVETALGASRG